MSLSAEGTYLKSFLSNVTCCRSLLLEGIGIEVVNSIENYWAKAPVRTDRSLKYPWTQFQHK